MAAPPASANAPDFATLPAALRVLLVTDGTVTRTLEAWFLEPIEIDVLTHTEVISPNARPEIHVAPGEPMVLRRVLLRGKSTGRCYAFAETTIASARLPDEVHEQLLQQKRGIGELLSEQRLETRRELLGWVRATAGELAADLDVGEHDTVLARTYRIHLAGRAVVEIREVFPLARFA